MSSESSTKSTKAKEPSIDDVLGGCVQILIKSYAEHLKLGFKSTKPAFSAVEMTFPHKKSEEKVKIFSIPELVRAHLKNTIETFAVEVNSAREQGKLTLDAVKALMEKQDAGIMLTYVDNAIGTSEYGSVMSVPMPGPALALDDIINRHVSVELSASLKKVMAAKQFLIDENLIMVCVKRLLVYLMHLAYFMACNAEGVTISTSQYRAALNALTFKYSVVDGKFKKIVVDFDQLVTKRAAENENKTILGNYDPEQVKNALKLLETQKAAAPPVATVTSAQDAQALMLQMLQQQQLQQQNK